MLVFYIFFIRLGKNDFFFSVLHTHTIECNATQ